MLTIPKRPLCVPTRLGIGLAVKLLQMGVVMWLFLLANNLFLGRFLGISWPFCWSSGALWLVSKF